MVAPHRIATFAEFCAESCQPAPPPVAALVFPGHRQWVFPRGRSPPPAHSLSDPETTLQLRNPPPHFQVWAPGRGGGHLEVVDAPPPGGRFKRGPGMHAPAPGLSTLMNHVGALVGFTCMFLNEVFERTVLYQSSSISSNFCPKSFSFTAKFTPPPSGPGHLLWNMLGYR